MFVLWERNANAISLLLPTNRWKKKISFVVIDVVCLFVFFFSLSCCCCFSSRLHSRFKFKHTQLALFISLARDDDPAVYYGRDCIHSTVTLCVCVRALRSTSVRLKLALQTE